MRYHVLVNPAAGQHRGRANGERLCEALRRAGHETEMYVTRFPGDGAAHVAGLGATRQDRLVVVGGDGTLREVLAGCQGRPAWPIGMLALGTANVVGRELRMHGHSPEAVARLLEDAQEWSVDIMRVTSSDGALRWAVANVGAGFDGEIVHCISALRAKGGRGGYARWVAPIWRTLAYAPSSRLLVTLDERTTYLAAGAVVQNARNYGGLFSLSPDAAMDSGTLEVMLVRGRVPRDRFRLLGRMALGGLRRDRGARILKATHVRIQSRIPTAAQADGDPLGTTDLTVALAPRAVTFLRPYGA